MAAWITMKGHDSLLWNHAQTNQHRYGLERFVNWETVDFRRNIKKFV